RDDSEQASYDEDQHDCLQQAGGRYAWPTLGRESEEMIGNQKHQHHQKRWSGHSQQPDREEQSDIEGQFPAPIRKYEPKEGEEGVVEGDDRGLGRKHIGADAVIEKQVAKIRLIEDLVGIDPGAKGIADGAQTEILLGQRAK